MHRSRILLRSRRIQRSRGTVAVRLDSRLVGRKHWLHSTTWPTPLQTALSLLPKEIVAMRRLDAHCDMRILLRPYIVNRCRRLHLGHSGRRHRRPVGMLQVVVRLRQRLNMCGRGASMRVAVHSDVTGRVELIDRRRSSCACDVCRYNRRFDGLQYNRRFDGRRYNRRFDGLRYNRRFDGLRYNRRCDDLGEGSARWCYSRVGVGSVVPPPTHNRAKVGITN